MSTSTDNVVAYLRSRFPPRLAVPVSLGLAAAGQVGGAPPGAMGFGLSVGLAGALFLQLRLLDDLADREHDRTIHPHRVLVRARSLRPFWALLTSLFGLNLVVFATWGDWRRVALFLLLNAALFAWYGWGRRRVPDVLLGAQVVLVKYPVIVYLVGAHSAGRGAGPLLLAMAVVYLGAGVYEALHDARLRAVPRARRVLALELAALAGIGLALLAAALGGRS